MDANAWIITSADVTFSDIFRIFAYFIGNWVMVVSLGIRVPGLIFFVQFIFYFYLCLNLSQRVGFWP